MLEQRTARGMSAKIKKKMNAIQNLTYYCIGRVVHIGLNLQEITTINFLRKKNLNSDLNAPEREQQKSRNYRGVSP